MINSYKIENQNTFKDETTNNNNLSPRYLRKDMPGFNLNNSKKAIMFVDANNWYFNVKKQFKPGEIDIIILKEIIEVQFKLEIHEIRWYTSMPSIEDGDQIYKKQRQFLGYLEKKGIKIITRKLQRLSSKETIRKRKTVIDSLDLCTSCKPLIEANFLDLTDIKRKEKGIDVWIAIDMLRLAVIENKCDICVLVSGDADFVPALEIIRNNKKEILTTMTPWGYSRELIEKFPYFILKNEILKKCLRKYEK